MNQLESAWAERLRAANHRYQYESVKLRLADRTWYTPDFMVITQDMRIQMHECKGFWEDDARVKIKVAAEQYPEFEFLAVQKLPKKQGGVWSIEVFKSSADMNGASFEDAALWAHDKLMKLCSANLSDPEYVRRNLNSIAKALVPETNPKLQGIAK